MPRGLLGSRVSCVIEAHSDSLLTVRFFVHFCVDSVVFFHIIHFIMDFFSVNMTGVFISVRRRLRSSSVPIALHLSWMRMWQGERWHIWSTLLSWLLFWCCCRSLARARHRHGNVHHVQLPWPFGRTGPSSAAPMNTSAACSRKSSGALRRWLTRLVIKWYWKDWLCIL